MPPRSAPAARPRLERETKCAIAVEQRRRIARARAFDREQPQFGRDSAIGGESAGLAAGGEHAMARHDERERVSPERLSDVAREATLAELRRDLPVRARGTRRNAARDLVDAAIELSHPIHVERGGGKIARLPAQQRDDAVDHAPHVRGRRRLACMRISPQEPRPGPRLARLRQLHAGDAARTPCDAAWAHLRVTECKAVLRHTANLAAHATANPAAPTSFAASTRRALRTPRASSATKLTTTVTVFAVALSSRSRLALSAFTSAEPTTTPSAPDAITAACSAVRTPKPTATGSLVWRLMRATAAVTFAGSAMAAPVMPVIET